MTSAKTNVSGALTRNMLIAARGNVVGARAVYAASDPTDPNPESMCAIVLLCGLAAELAFKAAYVKAGGAPSTARYSVGPDLRRAAKLAHDQGYSLPRPSTDQLLNTLSDAYLAVATRRYDIPTGVNAGCGGDILAWTEDLVADAGRLLAAAEKYPMPAFLARSL